MHQKKKNGINLLSTFSQIWPSGISCAMLWPMLPMPQAALACGGLVNTGDVSVEVFRL